MQRKRPADGHIAARLIEARKARGFSQGWLAKRIGVSIGTVQAYEHGRARIAASRLKALAEALGCDVAELLRSDIQPTTTIHASSKFRLYGRRKDE